MEMLFGNKRKLTLTTPDTVSTIRDLIKHLKDTELTEKPELFVQGDSVRPGILVLINDADWELEGELEYRLQNGDQIVFISTLHGG